MADQAKSSAQKAKLSQAALTAAAGALIPHSGALPMEGRAAAQEVDLEDLFSLRRPKNAWSGASSGLQSIAKGASGVLVLRLTAPLTSDVAGVVGGATALIAAPAIGAQQEGAVGFLKGLGAGTSAPRATPTSRSPHPRGPGLASAVILPVAGAAIGVVQLGRCAQPLLRLSLGAHLPSAAA
jgi:hypothetical protein